MFHRSQQEQRDAGGVDLFVVPGATIHSDEFKRCCGLKEKGYNHKTVKHVDRSSRFEFDGTTATRITTNHIERSWVDLRRSLRHQSGDEMGEFLNVELCLQWYLAEKSLEEKVKVVLGHCSG